ncbi:amidase [Actinomadura scrupuli]|uniref:amidase n=1 Tax=Actinomadura scrupuli TaxID=559629 RepID=UPI003D955BE8
MSMSRRQVVAGGAAFAAAATATPVLLAGSSAQATTTTAHAALSGPSHDEIINALGRWDKRHGTPRGEELCFLSAGDLLRGMRARRISPVEVAKAYLARIDRLNQKVNAIVYRHPEDLVLARARDAERRYANGTARPMEGLPYLIKDLFDFWKDAPNTFGSVVFKEMGFRPPSNAIYIQRMLDAGVNPMGKTNTPEFGHEGITDNYAFGPTSTPFDLTKNAGGSSGGSAAAVAGFLTALSQGSDAGGSVRIPAAFTSTVGFKATFGRIPQDAPPLPYNPMLHPGPISRTVEDAALSMEVMGGFYPGDKFSIQDRPAYLQGLRKLRGGLKGKRVAFSPNLDIFPVEQKVVQAVREGVAALTAAGARVDEVSLGFDKMTTTDLLSGTQKPVTQAMLSELWVMMQSALYGFARDLFLHYGIPVDLMKEPHVGKLNPEFRGMLERAAKTSVMEYKHGEFLEIAVNDAVEAVFARGYDYIVCPTLTTVSVSNTTDGNTLGPASVNGTPTERTIGWCMTYPFNFTGHPVVSVPAGFAGKMPVGMQIVGRRFADVEVLNAAKAVENHRPWHDRYPKEF